MEQTDKMNFTITGENRAVLAEPKRFFQRGHELTVKGYFLSVQKVIKRSFDIIGSLVLIFITFPLFIIIGAAIKLSSKGEIFYRQKRVGYRGKIFTIYKFRTMKKTEQNEQDHQKYIRHLLKEGVKTEKQPELVSLYVKFIESRITPVGKFLRSTSLDEIPQLFNILQGDMSFVGPRPHPVYEVAEYKDWYRERLKVKPGLTGWSKLKVRLTPENYEESILLDLWYVKKWNILLDLKIVLATVPVVFFMKDAH
ncbi:sugar transferase [candidate division KSB1 bacterium]|nr:MAG: sugar transferase [candidate division KSB1 bacterium]